MLLGAFGDPGHAFPMIALGRALAARGHHVTLQTWRRWQPHVEAEGIDFAPAPEYQVFPSGPEPLDFYEAVVHATRDTLPLVRELQPDVVVADILTLAPALAAEIERALRDAHPPRLPPRRAPLPDLLARRAHAPHRRRARVLAPRPARSSSRGLEQGRVELNRHPRAGSGSPRSTTSTAGSAGSSRSSRPFPSSSTRGGAAAADRWGANVHVVGPLMWEPPAQDVELPAGGGRAASPPTRRSCSSRPPPPRTPSTRMLRAALRGLADAPVRVLATYNRRLPPRSLPVPANARVVDWVSYSRTMPHCDLVVCHAGHGTLVRALASGCAVVACPAVGDMNENAARLDWAGAGVRVPRRFLTPRVLRLAVERALGDAAIRARARELAAWAGGRDAGVVAARLLEGHVGRKQLRGWDSNPQPIG